MLATEYAEYYGIDPQGAEESDPAFRERVAGALRAKGKLIEAHEAFQDARYEDSDDVMGGIIGALAQALGGVDYGMDDVRKIEDDIATGQIESLRKRGYERMKEDEYQYWAHKKSGEVWAVHIQHGYILEACGPLHHSERPEDMRDFEYSRYTGHWIEDNRKDYRLHEDHAERRE